jgi:hypothetical protein
VRSSFLALFLALPLLTQAQRSGVYGTVPWSVSDSNALVWGGQPYIPVGVAIDPSSASVAKASAAGLKDVILDVASNGQGWSEAASALEKDGMRYLLRLNSMAPLAPGVAVEPQSYRIAGITEARNVVLRLPGTTSALVIVAATRDGYVETVQRVKLTNGTLNFDVKPKSSMEHVMLVYPVTEGLEMPDFWEGMDQHRDRLIANLRNTKLGPGLRGIVNPLGRTLSLPGRDFDFVPTSPAFQLEMANLLEARYRNVLTAMRSWSMNASDFTTMDERGQPKATFNDLARLVPLWNGARGIPQLWDLKTDKLYPVDSKKSTVWKDLTEVVNVAGLRRFDRLVAAVRAVANVPVVQEWAGWAAPYENPKSPLDGVGIRASGKGTDQLIRSSSRAASSLMRWQNPGWLLASSVQSAEPGLAIDNLAQLGAKGFFFERSDDEALKVIGSESQKRASDATMFQIKPSVVFYPENAENPAQPQKLPGGSWWLPTPSDGNRIDLGPNFKAYRMNLRGVRTIALWTRTPGRYVLRMVKPDTVTIQTIDGSDPQAKVVKKGLELNLTDYPTLIAGTEEIPVPEVEVANVTQKFGKLLTDAQAAHRDATEERIAFEQAVRSFELNPGGSYATMLDQYYRAAQKLGTFTWLEAERVQETNFSEAILEPAASNGGALALRTPIPPDRAYYSEYALPARSDAEQTVWLAARIPADQRKNVQVLIGGQTMSLAEEPINIYGDGFGWYRLGTTRLAGGNARLRITVVPLDGVDLALDAILLTPTTFVPNGVTPPDPLGG